MLTIARQKFFNRYLPMFLSVVLIVAGAFVYLTFNNPQEAHAAINHVQTFKASGNSVSSIATASTATTAGDDLVAFCVGSIASGTDGTPSISDGVNSWSSPDIASHNSISAGKTTEAIFHAHNIAGGSITVTCSFGGTSQVNGIALFVSEFSGVDTTQADGAGLQGTGTNTAVTSGNFSTTNSSDLIVGFTENDVNTTAGFTQGSGWTIPTNGTVTTCSTTWCSAVEYQTNVSAAAYSATFTLSPTGFDWSSTIFAYKATAAGGGGGAAPEGERARGGTKARGGVRFR